MFQLDARHQGDRREAKEREREREREVKGREREESKGKGKGEERQSGGGRGGVKVEWKASKCRVNSTYNHSCSMLSSNPHRDA